MGKPERYRERAPSNTKEKKKKKEGKKNLAILQKINLREKRKLEG